MDKLSRRNLLRTLAGGALSTAGIVTLARTSLANVPETPAGAPLSDLDVQARAAELESSEVLGEAGQAHAQFINLPGVGGFGNGGRFRNLPFGNGGFRNGGFFNGGGFRNGGFRNGGFRNGGGGHGFRNSFRNH
ncbi:hypothetical protein [Pseudorhodoplanes sp.]|jgi:hypothetical protein|uniref:hypothetical protein n=1 Tax=Pseudorhodoplanes sp. TaxID=1934341 RepID=UPI002C0673E7|nr:hypothetical protein [Pseudorhodoplanes sp.]HWV41228.1 hypothetical protein [Pseudorhodoplanes sp.]